MTKETKQEVAQQLFENTTINREQYEVFKGLVEDLDLDVPEPEKDWDELINAL